MSFGILQTFFARVESLGILHDMPDLSGVMRQFQSRDSAYEQLEFPFRKSSDAMVSVPAYQAKFGRQP